MPSQAPSTSDMHLARRATEPLQVLLLLAHDLQGCAPCVLNNHLVCNLIDRLDQVRDFPMSSGSTMNQGSKSEGPRLLHKVGSSATFARLLRYSFVVLFVVIKKTW